MDRAAAEKDWRLSSAGSRFPPTGDARADAPRTIMNMSTSSFTGAILRGTRLGTAIFAAVWLSAWAPNRANAAAAPSAREIIDRHLKAVGGRENILKYSSMHLKGRFEIAAQGVRGQLEVFKAKPNKQIVRIDIPGLGQIQSGFDGEIGWIINPATGPMLLEGKMLEQTRQQADFDEVLHQDEDYQSMKTAGLETFEGQECYKLTLVRKSGQEVTEFFNVKSGLRVGHVATHETPFGAIPVTAIESDYKKFGSVLIPTKLTQKQLGAEQVLTIENVEYDSVPASVFEPPDAIKALAKKDN